MWEWRKLQDDRKTKFRNYYYYYYYYYHHHHHHHHFIQWKWKQCNSECSVDPMFEFHWLTALQCRVQRTRRLFQNFLCDIRSAPGRTSNKRVQIVTGNHQNRRRCAHSCRGHFGLVGVDLAQRKAAIVLMRLSRFSAASWANAAPAIDWNCSSLPCQQAWRHVNDTLLRGWWWWWQLRTLNPRRGEGSRGGPHVHERLPKCRQWSSSHARQTSDCSGARGRIQLTECTEC